MARACEARTASPELLDRIPLHRAGALPAAIVYPRAQRLEHPAMTIAVSVGTLELVVPSPTNQTASSTAADKAAAALTTTATTTTAFATMAALPATDAGIVESPTRSRSKSPST